MDIDTLARTVREKRIERGWSVEEAARRAGINRVTYKRIEDGHAVQDVKRAAVERLYGITGAAGEPDAESVVALATIDLNPDLTEFTDHELIVELERRMLVLAGTLKGLGTDMLTVTVDQDGERHIVSHTTKRR